MPNFIKKINRFTDSLNFLPFRLEEFYNVNAVSMFSSTFMQFPSSPIVTF